jgi:hypothetical protein
VPGVEASGTLRVIADSSPLAFREQSGHRVAARGTLQVSGTTLRGTLGGKRVSAG